MLEVKEKRKRVSFMELTQCINYLLTTAQHSVFQYLNSKLSAYDITPSQYGVLSCLWQRDFATPKQISEILCLETSTISGVLDRMQKKGLIDRVINREDRREVRVVPTEKGKALEEPISKIIDEVNEAVLKCFNEEEVAILKNQLRIIAEGKHF